MSYKKEEAWQHRGSVSTISAIADNPADLNTDTWLDGGMTDVKVPVTEYHVWYPFLLGLPSIRGLIERTDLHIALFIVANGNTAVTQLSEVTI